MFLIKKKNKFTVQPEAVEHILLSLLKFHNENHTPLLTDKEHPENWDNWFYYYKQILNSLELSEGKFYKYNNELSTRCEYCRLAYKDNSDITWPNITYGLINEFSVATEIVNKLEELEVAKQKADAEEAERKRIAAEKKRLEDSRFKGISNYKFGMSGAEVNAKGRSITKFAGYEVKDSSFSITKDLKFQEYIDRGEGQIAELSGELYAISIDLKCNTEDIKAIVSALCEKYNFKFSKKEVGFFGANDLYTTDYGVELRVQNYYGWSLSFTDTRIKEKYERQKAAALEAKKSALKNRNDF